MMDRMTGKPLNEDDHISQSVKDILFTPLGSRIERRSYGSELPFLIDQPIDGGGTLILRLMAATVMALTRWETRIAITRVTLSDPARSGEAMLKIDAVRRDTGQSLPLSYSLPV